MRSRRAAAALLVSLSLGASTAGTALAAPSSANRVAAVPFVFVGTSAQCGGSAGSRIVTSAWLGGMGLPDNGSSNMTPGNRDPHRGLLLNKNGPTSNCSAAGATITGFRSGSTISELGFDYRYGGHCGGGAPRFNVTSTAGDTYFVGCSAGAATETAAPQDPEWRRVRFTAVNFSPANPSSPPFVFGSTQVRSIAIIFDEGTDQNSPSDPTGVGLAVLDNIDINGFLITSGGGIRQ